MLDVAIIGAGAAGLGAAKAALSRKLSFKVMEAASFVGGRARTDTNKLGVPYDLGCRSLYGGSDNPFLAFAQTTGTRLGPKVTRTFFHDGTRFLGAKETKAANAILEQFESDLASAHQKASNDASLPDRSQADLVDASHPLARYLVYSDHPSLALAADVSLADPGCIVLPTVGEEVLDGFGALILRAAADIPVAVDCPVSAIDLSGAHVSLDTPMGRVDTRTVVVTVSTAVLAAERIALLPGGWPDPKMAAIDAVPTGSTSKIGFRLKPGVLPSEFTQLTGNAVAGSRVSCSINEPENINWQLGVGGGDLATAYVTGAFSRELALAGEDAQTDWAKQHLHGLLGNSIEQSIMGTCATPFDREPWIGGCNSYCRAGTGNQRPALSEAIEERVFFAGEACSPDYPGTAHGAWLSGDTAIEQIVSVIAADRN